MSPVRRAAHPLVRSSRAAALGVAVLLGLAACGGSSSGGASSAAGAAAPEAVAGATSAAAAADAGGLAAGSGAASEGSSDTSSNVQGRSGANAPSAADVKADQVNRPRRIRTAEMTLTVKNLDIASAQIRSVAEGLGGYVSSETTAISQPVDSKAADGSVRSVASGEGVVVLRIPEPDLDTALTKVGTIGTVVSRTQTDQDVTGEIADVASRIQTQRESVARTRELLKQAKSMQDIVFIEGQLTTREADLEALQARLKSLSDRADLSTLTVTIRVPEPPAPKQVVKNENSFIAGLKAGWEALVASTNVVLRILGALLPVAVLLLVVGYPASVLVRRRNARQQAEREAAAARWAAAQHPAQQPQQVPVMAGAPAPADAGGPADPADGSSGS